MSDYDEEDGYKLLLAFDRIGDDEEPFSLGFECGRLWEMAKANEEKFTQVIHNENAEMALRIAEALGREVSCVDLLNDCHMDVIFEARDT